MSYEPRDPDPRNMPERALMCAVKACAGSQYHSDRLFAKECSAELERRIAGHGPGYGGKPTAEDVKETA